MDKAFPGAALPGEDAPTFGGEPIKAAPSLSCLFNPLALQPATFLQAIQERIERRDVELHLPARAGLDEAADLVTVSVSNPGALLGPR